MRVSKKGIELIAEFEGFRSKPYLCSANVATIGFGNTFYSDGTKVTLNDEPISKINAYKLLSVVIDRFATEVEKSTVKLTQNQFDAVVSFVYNVGVGNYRKSTLRKLINANPNDKNIAHQFSRWNKGGGRVLGGLVKRRKIESNLYFS